MLKPGEKFAYLLFRLASPLRIYALILSVTALLAYIVPALIFLYYVILVLVGIFTLFLLFLDPTFLAMFDQNPMDIAIEIADYAKYVAIAAVGFALLAFVMSSFDRISTKRKGAIIFNSLVLAFGLLILAITVFGGSWESVS